MTSDVVLSAALRANLLSLQNTQKNIDSTQTRLSTGKKVNSALDNPQAFFAAQSLTNRASDLSNLLDSIGQSIQVINAANNGITALTSLVNNAQSLVQSAQTASSSGTAVASVTGNVNLGSGKLTSITGITTGDTLTFQISDPAGTGTATTNSLDLGAGGTGNHGTNAGSTNVVTIAANDTAADLVTKINDLNTGLTTTVVSASLDSGGHLVITAANGGSLYVKFGTVAATMATEQGSANALGFAGIEQANAQGALVGAATEVSFTQLASSNIQSKTLYSSANTIATASTTIATLTDANGTAYNSLANAAGTFKLSVGGKTSGNLFAATPSNTTIQNLVDNINTDATIKSLVSASYDNTTGKITLTALSASATDVQTILNNNGTATTQKLNIFGLQLTSTGATINFQATEDIRFGAAAGQLASLQTQYNSIRSQIDQLVTNGDTGYQGTNLLNGNNLVTYFDESSKSSLTTQGSTFTSSGLGISTANFGTAAGISQANNQVTAALSAIRNFGSTLATNLAVIQTRQDFTTSLINTLNDGAAKLVNSDQNTDGAELLALQTRQSLGVTALSLASQSQQSILRLFG